MSVISVTLSLVGTFLVLGSSLVQSAAVSAVTTVIKYNNFDDYLLAISNPRAGTNPRAQNQVLKMEGPHRVANVSSLETSIEILGYFRDVPRRHWSCCMLGKLAGDKGFSCQARFYTDRLRSRNVNRAHNKKTPFHGRYRVEGWGMEIMETFSRCVNHHSTEFHQCCYATITERKERARWHRYRLRTNSTVSTPTVSQS